MKRFNYLLVMSLAAFALGALVPIAYSEELVIFSFEQDLEGWEIPDWAMVKEDHVAEEISRSDEFASEGNCSLEVLTNFPGGKWTGAYVERMMDVRDWSQFGYVSVDIYLPEGAPTGLGTRIIFTIGENWEWTEMNRTAPLVPGKWTTITAKLKPGSMDWKFFPTDEFRKDIRKFGIRTESNHKPAYTGPIYIDNIKLIE